MTAPVPLSRPLRHFVNLAQQEQVTSGHFTGTDRLRPELNVSDLSSLLPTRLPTPPYTPSLPMYLARDPGSKLREMGFRLTKDSPNAGVPKAIVPTAKILVGPRQLSGPCSIILHPSILQKVPVSSSLPTNMPSHNPTSAPELVTWVINTAQSPEILFP